MRASFSAKVTAMRKKLLSRMQIRAELAGSAEIGVRGLVPGGAVVVEQHPDHARHRTGDVHLSRAEQWHAVEAGLARRDGGELGGEILGDGEDAADRVRWGDVVALEQLPHQLRGRAEDLLP